MPLNHPLSFKTLPIGVKSLLTVSAAVFAAQFLTQGRLVPVLGLVPVRVTRDLWLWQPFTYAFLHGGFFHFILNMYILWAIGREIEFRWGTVRFLAYFFACAAGAALFNVAFTPFSPQASIGASGAIYGLLVAFAVLYPAAVIYLYFFIPMKVWHVVIFLGAMAFLAGLSGASSGVANLAHLGGLLTGYLILKAGPFLGGVPAVGGSLWDGVRRWRVRKRTVQFHDVELEADRLLEKILKRGVDSLTGEERAFMDRYSRSKQKY
jgi:membrane associated rhomboid family serine protease